MNVSFTEEQQVLLNCASSGHNLLISGQAGTGKSTLVNNIVKDLTNKGKRVKIVCSSGISCSVYGDSVSSQTVHSCYGLQTADMPSTMVIARSVSLSHCMQKIKDANTIIWDEAGMSSKRILELVNAIHHAVADPPQRKKPFGGKQVILVGEFLQLRPVPNFFDDGCFMFQSRVFHAAVGHKFELSKLLRQAFANPFFLKALAELRLGHCSDESAAFLKSLSRRIENEDPLHIYFRKLSVQLHNLDVLYGLPGELHTFQCSDEGNVSGISCPADAKLLLKLNAKVMIVWNVSDDIKNGTSAIFRGIKGDHLEVDVSNVGVVFLKRETWTKRDRSGQIVGSRTQFPLVLAYAATCHKTQGLTLPGVVLHCSKEFVSGLTYVAVSRVENEQNLQVIGFNPEQLLRPPHDAVAVCEGSRELLDDLSCCSNQEFEEEWFEVSDRGMGSTGEEEHPADSLGMDTSPDGLVSSYFEKEGDRVIVDLETVFLLLDDNESQFSTPPESVDLTNLVKELLIPDPKTDFARDNNNSVTAILERPEQIEHFVRIQWYRIYQLFGDHLANNPNELYLSRKDFTDTVHHLYISIIGSVSLRQESRSLFQVDTLSQAQISIASSLCLRLFELFVHAVTEAVERQHSTSRVDFDVSEMPAAGLAKLRHVGGWAFRKELERARRYLRSNMFSPSSETRQKLNAAHATCSLLEDYAIVQYSWIVENTDIPHTLDVTENRQFRERGLLHISDAAFRFVLRLETLRVELINTHRIKQYAAKSEFVEDALKEVLKNREVRVYWDTVFQDTDADMKPLVDNLFSGVTTRYMRMASAQFLKDFRRAHQLKKTSEHRKRVLQRQQVATVRKDSIPFDEIVSDHSSGKKSSHRRLQVFGEKHGAVGLGKIYKKEQLSKLCSAYGASVRPASQNKMQMASRLLEAIKACRNEQIPYPLCVASSLQSSTETDSGRIVLRIRRI